MQAGAVDEPVRDDDVGNPGRHLDPAVRPGADGHRGAVEPQVDAGFVEQPDERLADAGEVDDPGGLDPQCGDAGDFGLVLAGLGGGDLLRRDAVGLGPLGEGVERRDLFFVGGDDELPADLDGHAVLPREVHDGPVAGDGHARLEGPRASGRARRGRRSSCARVGCAAQRGSFSSTVTSSPRLVSSQATARPTIPPPTTTTLRTIDQATRVRLGCCSLALPNSRQVQYLTNVR